MQIEGKEVKIKAARRVRMPLRRIYVFQVEGEDGESWALYMKRYMPEMAGLRMRDRVLITKLALTSAAMLGILRCYLEMASPIATNGTWTVTWRPEALGGASSDD